MLSHMKFQMKNWMLRQAGVAPAAQVTTAVVPMFAYDRFMTLGVLSISKN